MSEKYENLKSLRNDLSLALFKATEIFDLYHPTVVSIRKSYNAVSAELETLRLQERRNG